MKYNCYVKHNGVLYAPGTDVPEGETPSVDNKSNDVPNNDEQTNLQTPNVDEGENDGSNNEPPQNAENDGDNNTPQFTRTQIQQMNKETLIATAKELGIDFEEDNVTGNELKQMIMGKLGI